MNTKKMSEITHTALKRCVLHTSRDAFSQWLRVVCARARLRVCVYRLSWPLPEVFPRSGGFYVLIAGLNMAWVRKRRPGNISIMASAPSSALRRRCRRLWGTRTHSDGVTAMRCKKFSVFFFFFFFQMFVLFFLFFTRISLLRHASLQNKSSSCCSVKISFYVGK